MTEQIIIKGYWWLPSSPDIAVAGILTYIPNESIVLELVGQLKSGISAMEEFINREEEGVIFGYSSDAKRNLSFKLLSIWREPKLQLQIPNPTL